MSKQINVGIADMQLTRMEGILITYALGSCVGVSFYDPVIKLGALLHVMLPEVGTMDRTNIFKYADTGILETVRKMAAFGADKRRIIAKIAGGAKMFEIQGDSNFGNIGMRNVESVKSILRNNGISLRAEDTGANYARTMLMDVATGIVTIRTFGKKELTL